MNLSKMDHNLINAFKGLNLELSLSKYGDLIELCNFNSLKDSVQARFSQLNLNETLDTHNEDEEIIIDWELFDYFYRSAKNEKIFLDLFFPEILSYFQIGTKTFKLYDSNIENVEATFRSLNLFEIEMSKNTMLVANNKFRSEIECQYELTNKGCKTITKQLNNRIDNAPIVKVECIDSFDCQRSRIIQSYKFDTKMKIPQLLYQKKTITINDEPYYFWTEISIK